MPERILIVDDDLDSLKLIGLMLQRQGYEILVANSGGQALGKALHEQPDLVILDIMMPDMDGYEVCRRLRQNPATEPIPIIMFTAKSAVDDKVAGFEAGADDYLTKPTHPAELASRVKAVLARNAALRRSGSEQAHTIGFLGAKGGCGITTLALNVAASLAQREKTILADFRPGQSTLGLALGAARSTGMANLLSRPINELSMRLVENELVHHASGLRLLLSSSRPQETQMQINPDAAAAIVDHLRSLAHYVLLDMGSGLSRLNVRLLSELDHLTLAVEPNRISLTLARDLMNEIEQHDFSRARMFVVLINRTPSSLQVPWQEAEKMLEHEMTAIISPMPELAFQADEVSTPLILLQPNAIASTQYSKFAEALVQVG
jgi:DNA-binding response OmpR family regulator